MLARAILTGISHAVQRYRTRHQVATQAGIDPSIISDYLNGRMRTDNMTVGTLEKLLPLLDDVHVVYGAPPRGRLPVEIAPLVENWEELPTDSREHLLFVIQAVLETHGLVSRGFDRRRRREETGGIPRAVAMPEDSD